MSYSWFRVDNRIDSHPKILAFEAAIGDPNGLAYVTRLHCWTHIYATSGTFSKQLESQVEAHCKWRGEPGKLVATFVKFGLIDASKRTLEVHDWEDFQVKLVEKSKRDADVKRTKRAARRAADEEAARAGRAPGAQTAPRTVIRDGTRRDETGRDDLSNEPPAVAIVDSSKPSTPKTGIETNWGKVADQLAISLSNRRRLSGNLRPDNDADIAAVHGWALAWVLKYEPEPPALDQMHQAFNAYLEDPWAHAEQRDAALALWCSENVWLHRWNAERAKAAA